MKVLIIGASGFVGGALMETFGTAAVGTYCHNCKDGMVALDITSQEQVNDLIEQIQPSLIVHPAAQPNVDRCELDQEESHRVNVLGTRNVAAAALSVGARYVYFSTDYVFDGSNGPYAPDAPTGPINAYGAHKLEAERLIEQLLDNYLIVRVCGVYGYDPGGKNFVMGLIGKGSRQEQMNVPSDQWGTPTLVGNLAEAVKELALSDNSGVAHPVGPDYLSRIDFARLGAEVLGLCPDFLNPLITADLKQAARRPLRGGVDNSSTQALLKTRLLGAREGLQVVKKQMEEDRQ